MTSAASPSALSAEVGRRRDRVLRAVTAASLEAVLVLRPELIFYFAGVEPYPGEPSALLMRGDETLLVWPGSPPADLVDGVLVASYDVYADARRGQDTFARVAASAVERLRLTGAPVGLDTESRPLWLQADAVSTVSAISAVTRSKSAHEVDVIRANLALNDRAFASVAQRLRPGSTDFDVLDWCCGTLARESGGPVSYDGNIGLGRAGDFFDAQPCGNAATPSAPLFVDLYCRIQHYVGDSTRSFTVGPAPAWVRDAHGRLEQALGAVEREMHPGARAATLDQTCRDLLDGAVEGGVFPHHTGHGVGLLAHESPYLVPGSEQQLRPGDVVCVEPGLYFAGRGGVRLEEVYLITDDGSRPLTGFPHVLTESEVR